MIKYIRLNQQFDAEKMKLEVAGLEALLWKDHYNRSAYEGGWSTLQLRAIKGDPNNNTANHAGGSQRENTFQDTPLLAQCPYIGEVIDFFKMEKLAVRLMKLDAHATIKPHHDHDLNFEQGEVRIHIPVSTNPHLKFYLEEERLQMDEGSCWYLNLSLMHQVRNEGDTPRIHLVLDGIVNDWLTEYLQSPQHASALMQEPAPSSQYKPQDKLKIIEELRRMQTAAADKIADELAESLL